MHMTLFGFHRATEATHRAVHFLIFNDVASSCNSNGRNSKSIATWPVHVRAQNINLIIRWFRLAIIWGRKCWCHLNCVVVRWVSLIQLIISTLTELIILWLVILLASFERFQGITCISLTYMSCFVALIRWFGYRLHNAHDFLVFVINYSWRVIWSDNWLAIFDSDYVRYLRRHDRVLFAFIQAHSWIGTYCLELSWIASKQTVVAWVLVHWLIGKHAVVIQWWHMGWNMMVTFRVISFQSTLVYLVKTISELQEIINIWIVSVLIEKLLINNFFRFASEKNIVNSVEIEMLKLSQWEI